MSETRIRFEVELLEDVHCGSGLGWLGIIDDRHARDARGRPVVWDSTLAGLLRDAADELVALGLAESDRVQRLFGAEGLNNRSALVVRSLRFCLPPPGAICGAGQAGDVQTSHTQSADRPMFVVVTRTAREVHSRRPMDQTLRTVEMAAAGLAAEGELRFYGDEEDRKLIERCLRRLQCVGGGKTRGAGRVALRKMVAEQQQVQTLPARPANSLRLRLVLRNLEPLCVTATGYPGNVIASESYLPGTAIRGALLAALTAAGAQREEVDRLAVAAAMQVGNGYFVPRWIVESLERDEDIAGWESSPLPLTAQQRKRRGSVGPIPWWAVPPKNESAWLASDDENDLLAGERKEDTALKRIKREEYLVSSGEGFHRAVPEIATLLKNRIPSSRVERPLDTRRGDLAAAGQAEDDSALFAMDALVEDQHFLCDLRFGSADDADRFWRLAAPMVSGEASQRTWMRMGRGGAPVRIEHFCWMDEEPKPTLADGAESFTFTLTSDLIARADDLTFLTALDASALARLAGLRETSATIDAAVSVCEVRRVYGFNTAAATRRSTALAIKRGSAFLVRGAGGDLRRLFEALAEIFVQSKGLGERQEEGFGRFALDHPAHKRPAAVSREAPLVAQNGKDADMREAATDAALGFVKNRDNFLKTGPNRGQWQQLRHKMEVARSVSDIDGTFSQLIEHAKTLSGAPWKTIAEQLDAARRNFQDFRQQRWFVIYVCRWFIARLDEARTANQTKEQGSERQ